MSKIEVTYKKIESYIVKRVHWKGYNCENCTCQYPFLALINMGCITHKVFFSVNKSYVYQVWSKLFQCVSAELWNIHTHIHTSNCIYTQIIYLCICTKNYILNISALCIYIIYSVYTLYICGIDSISVNTRWTAS